MLPDEMEAEKNRKIIVAQADEIEILKRNVRELEEQLRDARLRNAELIKQGFNIIKEKKGMKFAILLDIDGDIMYLPNQWPCETSHNDPKLFNTIEEAEAERKNWNTGMIVDYFDDAIRPMNPEERKASLLRGLKNNGRK